MKIAITIPLLFLFVCLWSMDRPAKDDPAIPIPGAVRTMAADCLRGGDSTGIIPQGKSQTPSTWTPHQIDSLLKTLNIYTMYIGDTTGRYVQREVVERLLYNQHWRGRDSGFVFEGDDCIRVTLYLGQTAGVPDTVRWTFLCGGPDCRKLMTFPIICEETVTEQVEAEDSARVCDTTCTKTTTYVENRKYYAWTGAGFPTYLTLYHFSVCSPTSPGPGYVVTLWNGYEWRTWIDGARPITGPAVDSCYISIYQLAQYVVGTNLQSGTFSGLGPWYCDTNIVVTGSIPVDCASYGQLGVVRVIDNCRWVYQTTVRTKTYTRLTDLGRDTTLWIDTCSCFRPRFICEMSVDSIRNVIYIYERDDDTIKAVCTKEYTYQTGGLAYYTPMQTSRCTGDTNVINAVQPVWAGGSATPVIGYYRVDMYPGIVCRSCLPEDENSTPGVPGLSMWLDAAVIDPIWPCVGDSCIVETTTWTTTTNWCCEKDTTIVIHCYLEAGALHDSLLVQVTIPDLAQPCNDSVIVSIVPGADSTLVDSLVWYTPYPTSRATVQWYDSCECHQVWIIAGRTIGPCDTIRVEWDCAEGGYWTMDGILRIPCPRDTGQDYQHIQNVADMALTHADTAGNWEQLSKTLIPKRDRGLDSLVIWEGGGEELIASTGSFGASVLTASSQIDINAPYIYPTATSDIDVNAGGFVRVYPAAGFLLRIGFGGDEWITSGGRGIHMGTNGRFRLGAGAGTYTTVPHWLQTESAWIDTVRADSVRARHIITDTLNIKDVRIVYSSSELKYKLGNYTWRTEWPESYYSYSVHNAPAATRTYYYRTNAAYTGEYTEFYSDNPYWFGVGNTSVYMGDAGLYAGYSSLKSFFTVENGTSYLSFSENGQLGIGYKYPKRAADIKGGLRADTIWLSDGSNLLPQIDSLKNNDTLTVLSIDASAATYSLLKGTDVVLVDATSGNLTVSLPAPTGMHGYQVVIKRIDGTASTLGVTVTGGDNIDGSASLSLSSQYEAVTVVCDGTAWHIITWYIPPS